MRNRYREGRERAAFDDSVTELLTRASEDAPGHRMVVGVRNEKGQLYRIIEVRGLQPFLDVARLLAGIGFIDELEDVTVMRDGCNAIFSRTLS